ncbi:hypothetical protein TNCV_228061 [Trichonephila clavipes]|nr:hypothetical protein TNCV_228061 [Trichonephila clavipes]
MHAYANNGTHQSTTLLCNNECQIGYNGRVAHPVGCPLVGLGEARWEAPDHRQDILRQNWGETELKSFCHLYGAQSLALCHDEFRRRSDGISNNSTMEGYQDLSGFDRGAQEMGHSISEVAMKFGYPRTTISRVHREYWISGKT